MKPIGNSPSYLKHNHHSYCFRIRVPKDIQCYIGKKELKWSLKSGYLSEAKSKSRLMAGQVQRVFQYLRRRHPKLQQLSDTKIKELIQSYFKKLIDDLNSPVSFEYAIEQGFTPNFIDQKDYHSHFEFLDSMKEDCLIDLGKNDYASVDKKAEKLLRENGVTEIDKSSPLYWKLCQGLLRADIKGIDYEKEQMKGNFSDDIEKLITLPETPSQPIQSEPNQIESSPTLGEVAEDFWDWGVNQERWKPRSQTDFKRCLNHMLDFVGRDRQIHTVTDQDIVAYKEKVSKGGASRKTPSIKTIQFYMGRANTFFRYAIEEKRLLPKGTPNPVEGLIPNTKKKDKVQVRRPFDLDDLNMMLHSDEYKKDTHKESYQFWLPVLALFTGARIEELCQLYVDDIKQINGVWVLDINEKRPDQSVKNSERRMTPLHPFITDDLKFINFVKSIKDQKGRLFPDLKRINNRYGHYPSRWFTKYKNECGIDPTPNVKVFHSFRRTMISHLLTKSVPRYQIKMVVGHSNDDDITVGTYGETLEPDVLMEQVVMKLDYGLNLSHLKNSKYVGK